MSDTPATVAHQRGRGKHVALWLAAFTVVEYVVFVADAPLRFPLLTLIALAKAWLIVQYFMHIGQLRRGDH